MNLYRFSQEHLCFKLFEYNMHPEIWANNLWGDSIVHTDFLKFVVAKFYLLCVYILKIRILGRMTSGLQSIYVPINKLLKLLVHKWNQ